LKNSQKKIKHIEQDFRDFDRMLNKLKKNSSRCFQRFFSENFTPETQSLVVLKMKNSFPSFQNELAFSLRRKIFRKKLLITSTPARSKSFIFVFANHKLNKAKIS